MPRRPKGQEIQKLATDTVWGKALEVIRVDLKNYSLMQFERDGIMSRAGYRKLVRGPEGPTCKTLIRTLAAMGATMSDFATALSHLEQSRTALKKQGRMAS